MVIFTDVLGPSMARFDSPLAVSARFGLQLSSFLDEVAVLGRSPDLAAMAAAEASSMVMVVATRASSPTRNYGHGCVFSIELGKRA